MKNSKVVSLTMLMMSMTKTTMAMTPSKNLKKIAESVVCATQRRAMSQMSDVEPGQLYQHYKGNFYEIVTIGRYSEDPTKKMVVYKALYDAPEFGKNSVWVRPHAMFIETVVVDGQNMPRFKKIDSLAQVEKDVDKK